MLCFGLESCFVGCSISGSRFRAGNWILCLIRGSFFWILQLIHRLDRDEREPAESNTSKPEDKEFREIVISIPLVSCVNRFVAFTL